ncbi:MAG: hypothetical protein ACRDGQ_07690, partial [Candidatus Limnocylindrales bacterium]
MAQTDKLDEPNGRSRSAAIAVAVLVVTFIGVALLKPWGSGERPTATASAGATQRVSTPPSTTVPESAAPTVSNTHITAPPTPSIAQDSATPQISDFTTPLPPPATAAWTGLRWHLLATDDPLRLVRSVLRWRGGFIALGRDGTLNGGSTPVWVSSDGATWTLVPTTDSGPFWPGMLVIGLAEGPIGLVALTELPAEDTCDLPACEVYRPPVVSWTSPDGQGWTPNAAVDLGLPDQNTGAPLLAAGPKGLVVVSSDGPYLA